MILVFVLALLSFTPIVFAQGESVLDKVSMLLRDPRTILMFTIQIALGFGLGYFTVKALKYILALTAIILIGIFLNVWQFGGIEAFFSEAIGIDWSELLTIFYSVSATLVILIVLPVGIGFMLGIVTAAVK